jgi:tetratricopeptide (TPR) repeat protein
MAKTAWVSFPHPAEDYAYPGAALKKDWAKLHRGDREPFPAGEDVRDAWRAFHAGDFGRAIEAGKARGPEGYNAANKAAAIYTSYLETSDARKLKLLQAAMKRAEALQEAEPGNANAFYLYGLTAGRYSQDISLAKALAQGLGGRVREALDTALALEPKHADAHIALGAWHAEIVGKVGAIVARLTYGASRDAALEHFQRALQLNPGSAIARVEYARHLVLLFGEERAAEAAKLYAQAAKSKPMDAMERLDVEAARAARGRNTSP